MDTDDGREWQSISTVGDADVIVTEGYHATAVAFRDKGRWWLGRRTDPYRSLLDFEPAFWIERGYARNPFHLAFPDGRPSIRDRAFAAYPTES